MYALRRQVFNQYSCLARLSLTWINVGVGADARGKGYPKRIVTHFMYNLLAEIWELC